MPGVERWYWHRHRRSRPVRIAFSAEPQWCRLHPNYFKLTRNSYRIFLLGSASGAAERAASRLIGICRGRHKIAGCQNGYSWANDNIGILAKIRASEADVLLVAMGNPAQEMWLAENLEASGCRLGFGVGALFDFLSGQIPRAPSWVRSAWLEWCCRLRHEPGRLWRRYLPGFRYFCCAFLTNGGQGRGYESSCCFHASCKGIP
jgi:exopolysaccharide biosynthesis WecB/TagA/CpsF family protein